jgi:hypothetical protein
MEVWNGVGATGWCVKNTAAINEPGTPDARETIRICWKWLVNAAAI